MSRVGRVFSVNCVKEPGLLPGFSFSSVSSHRVTRNDGMGSIFDGVSLF